MKANLIELPAFNVDLGETEDDGASCLFGRAFLPEKWLEEGEFSPFTFYVGRINLAEFNCLQGFNEGFLYFFAEAKNFNLNCLNAKVRYYNGEIDAYTDYNEGFFDDEEAENRSFKIAPCEKGDETVLFSSGEKLVLLSIKSDYLPFEINGKALEFSVEKESALKGDFSKCRITVK